MRLYFTLALSLFYFLANAQTDSLLQNLPGEDLLENFIQNQEEETSFDYNDIFDNLEILRRRPLDLNKATPGGLDEFPFLTDVQKFQFLEYRRLTGNLISIYELQAVPGFDLGTIRQMLPYIKVAGPGILDNPFRAWKTEGKNQLLLRFTRVLEAQRGFTVPKEDSTASRYLGDRNRYYLRYRFNLQNRMSFGFTAEKDPGEEFFTGSNKKGFDFYSAHFFLKNPNGTVRTLALGDYSVSMGQGLLVYQGFATSKSAVTTVIKRRSGQLKPFASVNEIDFYRGAAATFAFGKNVEMTAFSSSRLKDGNLGTEPDPGEPEFGFVTSLQTSGLHRTHTEIEDKNSVRQTSAGATLKYKQRRWHVALNSLFEHLDKPLQRTPDLYNRYYFNGNRLFNSSADYTYTFRNYHFFGETAVGDNGAVATLNGLLIALDRRVELALLQRHFPRNYQTLNGKPFAESSGARNEDGLFIGMAINPNSNWRFNGYFDLWSHPWARFGINAPSEGYGWLARLTYTVRKKMEAYVQVRNEVKEENTDLETKIDILSPRQNFQGRLHLSYKLSKNLEWRSRIDAGYTKFEGKKLTGTMLFQDLIYKSLGSPLTFSTRFAIFDTDEYAIRFYAYENDILYSFSIPAYYGRGTRFYLNLRYRLSNTLTAEARYSRTYYSRQDVNGSGLDEISGPEKSEIKVQLKWGF